MCYGTILSSKIVVGRVEHRCDICSKPIPKGRKHERMSIAHEGEIGTVRQCIRCVARMLATGPDDGDGCFQGDPRDIAKDYLANDGWSRFRQRLRAARDSILGRKRKPAPVTGEGGAA